MRQGLRRQATRARNQPALVCSADDLQNEREVSHDSNRRLCMIGSLRSLRIVLTLGILAGAAQAARTADRWPVTRGPAPSLRPIASTPAK